MNSDKQVKIDGGSALSYHAFVQTLVKKFSRATSSDGIMTILHHTVNEYATKLEFMHLAVGLATEASEAADVIKAHAIYGKEFDRAALVKELGDLRFWIQDAQNKFHISDHEIAQGNADKLSERYKKLVYTDKNAIARVDKKYAIYSEPSDADESKLVAGPFEHEYEATKFIEEHGGILVTLE